MPGVVGGQSVRASVLAAYCSRSSRLKLIEDPPGKGRVDAEIPREADDAGLTVVTALDRRGTLGSPPRSYVCQAAAGHDSGTLQ